jgi:hypothetical protein
MSTVKDRVRIKQLILTEIAELVELWPDINVVQHLCTIMRPYTEAYLWSNEMLLKKIEKYRDELENPDDDE